MLTRIKIEKARDAVAIANPTMTRGEVMDAVAKLPTDYSYAYEPGSPAKDRARARHLIAVSWWLFKYNLGDEPGEPIPPFEHPAQGHTRRSIDGVVRNPVAKVSPHTKTLAAASTMRGRAALMLMRDQGATAAQIMTELNCTMSAAKTHISDVKNNMGLIVTKCDDGVTFKAKLKG